MSSEFREKPEEQENEEVKEYLQRIEAEFSNFESAQLSEDRSVSVGLVGEERFIYKSPKELLRNGLSFGAEEKKKIGSKVEAYGAPFILRMGSDIKFSDLNLSEELAQAVKKDLNAGYVLAPSRVNIENLDGFAGLEDYNRTDQLFMLRDEIFQGIADGDISEAVRAFNFQDQLASGKKIPSEYLEKMKSDNPDLLLKFIDFSIRTSLSGGHELSSEVFIFLQSNPDIYDLLDKNHKEYSLPYLFERDLYERRWLGAETDGLREEREKEYKSLLKSLNIDGSKVQQTIKDLGGSREYCPGFFSKN